MIRSAVPLAVLALAAPAAAMVEDRKPARVGQVTIHQRTIIRVPLMPKRAPVGRTRLPVPVTYKESKGPSCVTAAALAGAAITAVNVVDLVLVGGTRLRARLDGDCAPLDFYSGFYLRPAGDGRVCARRDSIRVRSGASCTITRFRMLTPQR